MDSLAESNIDQAIATVCQSLESKDIRLHCLLDPLPRIVQGDPERLQQIVLNLLTNAIKFTSIGGRIEVSLQTYENQANNIILFLKFFASKPFKA